MIVMKFGGSSLADGGRIKQAAGIVRRAQEGGEEVVVVCSAMGGATDVLIEMSALASARDDGYLRRFDELCARHLACANELLVGLPLEQARAQIQRELQALGEILRGLYLIGECTSRSRDLVMSFGERLSTFLVCEYMKTLELGTQMLDAREVVKTDEAFGNAGVKLEETYQNIRARFESSTPVRVVTGFIGSTGRGETTTLGRGGSDYTASLFGAALAAREIQIWTDVDGVLTADPRLVEGVHPISEMTYEEAMEMSHFGAKVIYPPTMTPAREAGIPIIIKNTFNADHPGTRIHEHPGDNGPLKGISSIRSVALIYVSGPGMVGVTGTAGRMFSALAEAGVNVIMISQGSSEQSICAVVASQDAHIAVRALKQAFALEILQRHIDEIVAQERLSVIAVIGERMRQAPGIGGKIFTALGDHSVNVVAVAQGSSERNISIVVREDQAARGQQAIHDRFFTGKRAPLQVFVVGMGLVGSTLIKQIAGRSPEQTPPLASGGKTPRIELCGVANSRRMLLDLSGIDPSRAKEELESRGEPNDLAELVHRIKAAELPHPVLVDCTASDAPVGFYEELLRAGISVVTPNKRATTGALADYRALKAACRGSRFCYETNVGAGLPVISVMRNLVESGDHIHKVEGTLSGTLSYLFNTFDETMSFTHLLREAKAQGYTEPDPRDDLSGLDVARKLLILAREMGLPLELSDIDVENLVPEDCREAQGVDAFFERLAAHDGEFSDRLRRARATGNVLRYVASVAYPPARERGEDGVARVRLAPVPSTHPCASLSGSDNLFSFTTDRYHTRPLVVRGPGAGAEVTAAGVLSDILSCSP